MKKPRDYLTIWHTFYLQVTDKTRVVFVGPFTTSITHYHPKTRVFEVHAYQPTHVAEEAGYCPHCDVLYLTRWETDDDRKDSKAIPRIPEQQPAAPGGVDGQPDRLVPNSDAGEGEEKGLEPAG